MTEAFPFVVQCAQACRTLELLWRSTVAQWRGVMVILVTWRETFLFVARMMTRSGGVRVGEDEDEAETETAGNFEDTSYWYQVTF